MTDNTQLKEDIAFVRAAAERSDTPSVPAIYLLWALLGGVGFALVDFVDDYSWIGTYWLFAGPIGFVLSAWFGMRTSRSAGFRNRQTDIRHFLHWLAFMAAGVLGLPLVQAGQLTWAGFGSLWVLLLGLTYFYGGLYLERRADAYRRSDGGRVLGHGLGSQLWLDYCRCSARHRACDRRLARSAEA